VALSLALADEAATGRLAAALAPMLRAGDAVLLSGPLGAGKSSFARALLRAALGDPALDVPSPTYTLVQGYEVPGLGLAIAHFDLWRLAAPAALHELGWDEAREGVVLVEWPDRLGPLAPPGALRLDLAPTGPHARAATLAGWPAERLAELSRRFESGKNAPT
jgi:tRNA threonylcarbamoyladenosine biosynthesis protein TsaE